MPIRSIISPKKVQKGIDNEYRVEENVKDQPRYVVNQGDTSGDANLVG
jgi:hypothetical protein